MNVSSGKPLHGSFFNRRLVTIVAIAYSNKITVKYKSKMKLLKMFLRRIKSRHDVPLACIVPKTKNDVFKLIVFRPIETQAHYLLGVNSNLTRLSHQFVLFVVPILERHTISYTLSRIVVRSQINLTYFSNALHSVDSSNSKTAIGRGRSTMSNSIVNKTFN